MSQTQQAQFGAPSAQVQGEFVAPSSFQSNRTKLPVELIPPGLHLCTIYGAVGIGTHMESFQGQEPKSVNKVFLAFEFPQFKQKFYEEDEGLRSTSLFVETSLSAFSDKSKLRAILEAACQRPMGNQEAADFNLSNLIGLSLVVSIQHYSKKNGTGMKEKIVSFNSSVGFQVPVGYQPENERWMFYLDAGMNNFRTEMFAKLPHFLKSKLIESKEGQTFISQGGIFAKLENDNQESAPTATPVPPSPQAPVAQKKIEMLVNDFTYEQYIQSGWTDDTLVANNKARWVQPVAPVAPAMPQAPAPAPAPSPSAPPQAEQTPAQSWLEEEDEDDMPF